GPGGMENNPDIVQEFFTCLDRKRIQCLLLVIACLKPSIQVAQNLPGNFYMLPAGGLDALM
ncbi:hypothetical protein MPER_15888, partial [Moniliophthora perniciosa FA553]